VGLTVKIDTAFVDFNSKSGLSPIERKYLLSLVNDYEDEKWRYEEFQDFVWDNVAQTALTQRERTSALSGDHSRLRAAAKNLRLTDAEPEGTKGSEIAEIVLYGVMRHHFGALPVVPKIFYKQNVNDYAKGADSVHIVVKDGDFSVFFGEAKFYSSLDNARLAKVIESVNAALDTEKLKKENSIVTNLHELELLNLDPALVAKIRSSLSAKISIDDLKPRLNVPILLLHQCEITGGAKACDAAYLKTLEAEHLERAQAYFERQIDELSSHVVRYDQITFHLILIPVPSKKEVVERFVATAKAYKGK
jgi:hypothetical protein